MSRETTKPNKWRDENGNVYAVEKTTRNGRFVVIRTNPGGNRKAARVVPAVGSAAHVQKKLDEYAAASGWAVRDCGQNELVRSAMMTILRRGSEGFKQQNYPITANGCEAR